jgi:hypothetical protein
MKLSCEAKIGRIEGDCLHLGGAGRSQLRRDAVAGSGLRTASTTRAARSATSLRTVATPRSEVPPSTSTDCTVPRASFTIASFRLR